MTADGHRGSKNQSEASPGSLSLKYMLGTQTLMYLKLLVDLNYFLWKCIICLTELLTMTSLSLFNPFHTSLRMDYEYHTSSHLGNQYICVDVLTCFRKDKDDTFSLPLKNLNFSWGFWSLNRQSIGPSHTHRVPEEISYIQRSVGSIVLDLRQPLWESFYFLSRCQLIQLGWGNTMATKHQGLPFLCSLTSWNRESGMLGRGRGVSRAHLQLA